MVNDRWSYQVVELKGFMGVSRDVVQEKLTQLGLQGWELVSVVMTHPLRPVQLYLKKPM
ncbi:DUF4177 domain-containing protein [Lysobacter sp. KIS68-7]|uniref:DUF4177 domain-containing protein n=1 Tax=Lysobacter sp. KIS68-7 TaxID=2904252 RepID=UPI001E50BF4E|nr:DUF4177 domain-containing protein [Lysobacter sp. KIS68-7]UHQ18294.1 DUF4177 domain-containing protein [Lysobacter sp. KIS68-7]